MWPEVIIKLIGISQNKLLKRVDLRVPKSQIEHLAAKMQALHKFVFLHLLTCLKQNALGSEIIHGEKAPENDLLYMASVQSKQCHICGGALLTEDFVLTAAHCDDGNPTSVVLGTHNLRNPQKIVSGIVKKCKHPSYKKVGNGQDFMLLKLSRKITPNERVKFIQLPSSEITLKENEECRVAGWGSTVSNGGGVDQLRVVDVSVISPQICRDQWRGLADNVICAGGYKTKEGFCQGDSGGPLVCRGMAVGVVSFNYQGICDYPNKPNVYADISAGLDWIQKVLKEKDC